MFASRQSIEVQPLLVGTASALERPAVLNASTLALLIVFMVLAATAPITLSLTLNRLMGPPGPLRRGFHRWGTNVFCAALNACFGMLAFVAFMGVPANLDVAGQIAPCTEFRGEARLIQPTKGFKGGTLEMKVGTHISSRQISCHAADDFCRWLRSANTRGHDYAFVPIHVCLRAAPERGDGHVEVAWSKHPGLSVSPELIEVRKRQAKSTDDRFVRKFGIVVAALAALTLVGFILDETRRKRLK